MLLRILPVLLITLLLPVCGIDRMLLRPRWKRVWRTLVYLPNVLLSLALMAMAFNESYSSAADYWKGTLLTLTLCLSIPQVVMVVLLLPAWWLRKRSHKISCALNLLASVTGVGLLLAMLYGFTLGYRQVNVERIIFASPRIPQSFDGYRIVQITDLHLGTLHGRAPVLSRIVDSINACQPDLVVFTGDLVNYRSSELFEFEPELRRIRAKDGVISVMGNHDYAQYYRHASSADSLNDIRTLQQHQRDMHWQLLLNEHILLRRSTDSMAIIGVENGGRPPFPNLARLPQAQAGLSDSCFKVLLSHDPTFWRREVLPHSNIDITLSGHTHGMQLKIGNFSPAQWFYDEWGGKYEHTDGRMLYVSMGTGSVMMPFRLGAWPEVTLITLKATK